MASNRIQRHIERPLGEVDAALAKLDWEAVRNRAQAVLALDRDNKDALSFLHQSQDGIYIDGHTRGLLIFELRSVWR